MTFKIAGASGKDGAAIVAPEQSTPASAEPDASAGTSPESGVGTHTESPSRNPGGGEPPAAKTELDDGHGGAESAHSIGIADAASPWYRRPGILIAAAALIAEVGIVVSGPGEPGTAPGGTIGTSTPWSASFSLIATDFWEPAPEPPAAAPPAAAPPAPAPPPAEPPAPAPRRAAPPAWEPPEAVAPPPPPPPPPPELVIRFDDPLTAAFVSITNNDKPAVGCVRKYVAVAGVAAAVNYNREYSFTVTGSEETRIPQGSSEGPATGSTWQVTVTCDNGLSTSREIIY